MSWKLHPKLPQILVSKVIIVAVWVSYRFGQEHTQKSLQPFIHILPVALVSDLWGPVVKLPPCHAQRLFKEPETDPKPAELATGTHMIPRNPQVIGLKPNHRSNLIAR